VSDNDRKPLTDKERQAQHRAKQKAEGRTRVAGWVPKERAEDARELLAGLAAGRNELLPSAVAEREEEIRRLKLEAATARAEAAEAKHLAAAAVAQAVQDRDTSQERMAKSLSR
jgi:hypothetical protein